MASLDLPTTFAMRRGELKTTWTTDGSMTPPILSFE